MEKKRLQLYVHIPFCEQKCAYCDFLSAPADGKIRQRYVEALLQEVSQKAAAYKNYSVPSLFLGGGTPSVLMGNQILAIMEGIRQGFHVEADAEITIECNPGTLNPAKLDYYIKAGINRISLGLQSARNPELKLLGRIHTYEQFLESLTMVKRAGFDNVNVDLMQALPGQSLEDWAETLKAVTDLKPSHLSVYSLIIEEGTSFQERYGADELLRQRGEVPKLLPGEELERSMYEWSGQYLSEHGYEQYEISNYARSGKECRHNLGYWRRENYLGLGLGSASLVENRRFTNTTDLTAYLEGGFHPSETKVLPVPEQMEEYMFLGLRCSGGISRMKFEECFGTELQRVYGTELGELTHLGLLGQREGRVFLTPEGISVSNYVMSRFLKEF